MIFKTETYSAGMLAERDEWDSVALTYTVFDGDGAQVSQRALTAQEQAAIVARAAADAAEKNAQTLRDKAHQALTTNAAYLAIPAPTAAEVRTQTELLTREVNGLIRLALGQLEDISDT